LRSVTNRVSLDARHDALQQDRGRMTRFARSGELGAGDDALDLLRAGDIGLPKPRADGLHDSRRRQQLLDGLGEAIDEIASALASLGEAYEQRDEQKAEELEQGLC
jgi:hypothetical protein